MSLTRARFIEEVSTDIVIAPDQIGSFISGRPVCHTIATGESMAWAYTQTGQKKQIKPGRERSCVTPERTVPVLTLMKIERCSQRLLNHW